MFGMLQDWGCCDAEDATVMMQRCLGSCNDRDAMMFGMLLYGMLQYWECCAVEDATVTGML